jgi:replicative DNA helicase
MEIRAKARRLKQRQGDLGLIIVDYLQLMQSHRRIESRQQEVSEISRSLKMLAKELDTPVIALSQLSRNPEARTDKRPMLADLRESGSIEQDADIVGFIYNDAKYDEDTPDKGIVELIIAKHRNGATRTIKLAFLEHLAKFANLQRQAQRPSGGGPGGPVGPSGGPSGGGPGGGGPGGGPGGPGAAGNGAPVAPAGGGVGAGSPI